MASLRPAIVERMGASWNYRYGPPSWTAGRGKGEIKEKRICAMERMRSYLSMEVVSQTYVVSVYAKVDRLKGCCGFNEAQVVVVVVVVVYFVKYTLYY